MARLTIYLVGDCGDGGWHWVLVGKALFVACVEMRLLTCSLVRVRRRATGPRSRNSSSIFRLEERTHATCHACSQRDATICLLMFIHATICLLLNTLLVMYVSGIRGPGTQRTRSAQSMIPRL
jgi:hypothetical protein